MVLESKGIYDLPKLVRKYKLPHQFLELGEIISNMDHFAYPSYGKIVKILTEIIGKQQPINRVFQWHRSLQKENRLKDFSEMGMLLEEQKEDDFLDLDNSEFSNISV